MRTRYLRVPRRLLMAAVASLSAAIPACGRSAPAHPLATLALAGEEAPPPCELAGDARPMFMLPTQPSWQRDLGMTVGWWIGRDFPSSEIDAALSHMLRRKGEESADRPAVVLIALRLKAADVAADVHARVAASVRAPVQVAVHNRTVLLQAPTPELPTECADALWNELVARLHRL
jgi:hypothetical protein